MRMTTVQRRAAWRAESPCRGRLESVVPAFTQDPAVLGDALGSPSPDEQEEKVLKGVRAGCKRAPISYSLMPCQAVS